jgi:hypothetical protein
MKTIRSASDRVAELNAKIAQIEAREQRKSLRQTPVFRETVFAVKAIDRALLEAAEGDERTALQNARAVLGQVIPLDAVRPPRERSTKSGPAAGSGAEPAKGPRALKPREKKPREQAAAQ